MRDRRTASAWMMLGCGLLALTGCAGPGGQPRSTEDTASRLQLRAIDEHTQAEACRLTGLELAAHEKDEHAISQFERARKLAPELEGIAHPLAVLYDRQGRLDAAQREYERALRERPRDADVYNDFGYFLYSRGSLEAAQSQLHRALELHPEHPKARINLAMVLAARNQFEEAFVEFEQALGPAAAHHNIGLLLLRNGERERAIAHLEKSARTDPSLGSQKLLAAVVEQSPGADVILPASATLSSSDQSEVQSDFRTRMVE